ncbi:MAG: lolB [Ramlibacter sp.]|nr:lolB [Ramlibacter sp.]
MTRAWRWLGLALLLAVLAGCATPRRAEAPPGVQVWSGRLALNVDGAQPFSAGFELKGEPATGELTLFNPLGGTAGVLTWAPGSATLRTGRETRQFDSLEALAKEVTGTPLPIAALFDWLQGRATDVPGWQVDVSQVAQGRLRAQRTAPPPAADLRVAFER